MSGFQIPGLGQAKPNETLPPLPADVLAAAASVSQDADMKEATETPTSQDAPQPEASDKNEASDSMAIDQPESPPSLTGALEAALGGLDNPPPQSAAAPSQPEASSETAQQTEGGAAGAEGEHPEWEMDSSPYESSSESSSDSDSDSDDSDNEGYELLSVEETARMLMEAEGGSDDEGGGSGNKSTSTAHLRTKNEVAEEAVPKPDITITPDMKIEELGAVEHIVDNLILVKAITPGEYQVLDTGSALCTADRTVIGAVSETIGKVLQPMYTVRFSTADEIRDLGLAVGSKLFYPVDHASFVFTQPLKNYKGSDASNLHDEEVGDDDMEFSDDEKEAEYKRSLKQKKRDKWKAGAVGSSSNKEDKNPHPLRQEVSADGGLNYDDDVDDGPYKPLTRPAGFGSGPTSAETYEPAPRPNFRGRRGDGRGRAGRGRGGGRGGPRRGPSDGHSLPPQGQPSPAPQQAGSWNGAAPSVPGMPNFGFQMPGWPRGGGAGAVPPPPPPPPPGWPGAQGNSSAEQSQAPGAFVNPALFAALMSQMQQQYQQGGQNGQGGQR